MNKLILTLVMLIQLVFIHAQRTIDITYIANEGFLISGKTDKILIDGIFTQGWGKYHIPAAEALTQEREALSPFDSLTFLLVSHNHADHINPDCAAEHMMNDERPVLLCPSQVNDLLKPLNDYNTIKNRVIVIIPGYNTKIDTTIQNLKFKIISLQHPDDIIKEIQNIGFIFNINGFKIFHPGDAVSDNLSVYQNLNIAEDSIDIAFLPRWFFDTEYGDKGTEIIKYIKPKAIIIMHVNTDKYAYYKNAVKSIQGIPPVYFMEATMNKLSFKKNDSISVITAINKLYKKADRNPSLNLIPNPTTGFFTISFGATPVQEAFVEICNTKGALLYSKVHRNMANVDIDLTGHPQGVYFARLIVGGDIYYEKISLNY